MIQMSKDAKLHAIPALYWSPCQNILSNFTERRREMGEKISFHQIRIDIFVSLPFAVGRVYQELQFIWIKKNKIYGANCWSSFSSFLCQIVCSVNVLNIDWVWMRDAVISISISISKRSFDAIYTIKSREQRKTDIKNLVLQRVERPLKMSSEICGTRTW